MKKVLIEIPVYGGSSRFVGPITVVEAKKWLKRNGCHYAHGVWRPSLGSSHFKFKGKGGSSFTPLNSKRGIEILEFIDISEAFLCNDAGTEYSPKDRR